MTRLKLENATPQTTGEILSQFWYLDTGNVRWKYACWRCNLKMSLLPNIVSFLTFQCDTIGVRKIVIMSTPSFPRIAMELTDQEITQYFTPRDLAIGKTSSKWNRHTLVNEFNCSTYLIFCWQYFRENNTCDGQKIPPVWLWQLHQSLLLEKFQYHGFYTSRYFSIQRNTA